MFTITVQNLVKYNNAVEDMTISNEIAVKVACLVIDYKNPCNDESLLVFCCL